MAIKIYKTERPNTVIKTLVTPITNDVKIKTSQAIQTVVNRIKEKHL
jgi:hypothetical protein